MPRANAPFLHWLWFFVRPYRSTVIKFSIFRVSRNAIMAMLPFVVGRVINAFQTGWAFVHPERFAVILMAAMTLYTLALMSIILFGYESRVEDRMIRGMRLYAIRHLNRLPLDWHEAQGSGGQLQRVMTARAGLERLSRIYRWNILPFFGVVAATIFSVIASHAPFWLLLLYIGLMITYPTVAYLAARPLPALHNRHNGLLEKLLGSVYEFVSAIRTVKTFRMESFIEARALDLEGQGHAAILDLIEAIFRKWLFLNLTGAFWLVLIFSVCVVGVFHHWLSPGAFATCFFLAYNLWNNMDSLVSVQDEFIESRNGFMRLTQTLTQPPQRLDMAPVQSVPAGWAQIALQDVTFNYAGHARPALHKITLSIRRGEKVALVGRSGAGKSTLVKLLLKQAWPASGMIRIGDVDLRYLDSNEWLHDTGYVPQEVELFNLSIRENILLDRVDEVDETAYHRAIDQAALRDFIANLPEGDATMVGERGIKLSGGQRQRLGIARSLVRHAELIVFDEATSALDSLSEAAIREAIETAFADKTLILIAHRLATVRHVDRIFVFDDGRLAEQGSFDELLRQKGLFAQLWSLQSEAGAL